MMNVISPGGKIGIIGGGHIARMMAQAAFALGYRVHIFCRDAESPAVHVSNHVTLADFNDTEALEHFAENVDIITFEREEIPNELAIYLSKTKTVIPRWKELDIAYNRLKERGFLHSLELPIAKYCPVNSAVKLEEAYYKLNCSKAIFKAMKATSEGSGHIILEGNNPDFQAIWDKCGIKEGILEPIIPFTKELSVIIARGFDTKYVTYDVTEYINNGPNFCSSVTPADISEATRESAYGIANKIANELHLVGILTVEFFMKKDGSLLVNEITPRPNETGYWTQGGCFVNQFEQFIRAICGLPLGSSKRHSKVATNMVFGKDDEDFIELLKDKSNRLYLYGLKNISDESVIGHINKIIT
ncbi:MAG: ATP-grasp domain-containing protein [Rickettsiales bacterium]|nr:ATP-grasp domain-containing protein [Pseudomonadota bacterium]MDA0966512.1 ATP-grasp domain-containing protein [Pseudomonadota bacterium]MDG4543374.1 ATP-grasp domain-containing protein [Rickettsiales bacterium]MDG4545640.1 ATP-grasp domain-containing protein [Rickettsiales bacterium]MDG4548089.1 ATP-grasp domain-containing protein [Rickettsiales bacterium]